MYRVPSSYIDNIICTISTTTIDSYFAHYEPLCRTFVRKLYLFLIISTTTLLSRYPVPELPPFSSLSSRLRNVFIFVSLLVARSLCFPSAFSVFVLFFLYSFTERLISLEYSAVGFAYRQIRTPCTISAPDKTCA